MSDKTCIGCKFNHPENTPPKKSNKYFCHRFPPVVLPFMNIAGEMETAQYRPVVQTGDVCGEWKNAVEPNNAVSRIFPWVDNIHGRMDFSDWFLKHAPSITFGYHGEELRVIQDGKTLKAQPGDRIFLSSNGVQIQ